jgi:hypothetical protein
LVLIRPASKCAEAHGILLLVKPTLLV